MTGNGTRAWTQGLVIDGSRVHAPREGYNLTGLPGWRGRPQGSRAETPRVGGLGTVPDPLWPGSRAFSIVGYVHSTSRMTHLCDELAALWPDPRGEETLTVVEDGVAQYIRARAVDLTILDETAPGFRDFQIQLVADDPRRFGEAREFTSSTANCVVHQRGSWPADPTVTVRATSALAGGYRLRLTGEDGHSISSMRFNALATGSRHVVEPATGIVRTTAGAVVPSALHSGAPWRIPRGERCTVRLEVISGGAGVVERVQVTDTYM